MTLKPGDLIYNTKAVREWIAFKRKFDLSWQSIFNGGSALSHRELNLDQADYWVGLDVPEGKRVILWERDIDLTGGRFTVDVYSGTFDAETGTDFLRNPLSNEQTLEAFSSVFKADVTPTGTPQLVEYGYQRVASDGFIATRTGALKIEDLFKTFKGPVSGLLKITRLNPQIDGGGTPQPFDLNILYIGWEEDV